MMKTKLLVLALIVPISASLSAQVLTLDSCRALALRNNKELMIGNVKIDKAMNERKAAHTNYLPKISFTAGYMHTGDEISLLSDDQKHKLSSMGTTLSPQLTQTVQSIATKYPDLVPLLQSLGSQAVPGLNQVGQEIVDAFKTDTRNVYAGALILTQPLYMGGKIKAYENITKMSEDLAGLQLESERQTVLQQTDQAYWQVVSLANKKKLAEAYLKLLRSFDSDVQKMQKQGVATRSDELSISVKVNEAEMTLMKVEDGLQLSRMLLCQICGIPISGDTRVADEEKDSLEVSPSSATADVEAAYDNRPEIKQLEKAISIYDQKVKITRSDYLPHLALTGGYMVSNPNTFNGFQKNFRGTWNVGVTLSVPVWTWNEHKYKINATKAEAQMTRLQLTDAKEKIELQLNQAAFNVNEATKRLSLSLKNEEKATENLRMANAAFKEGVETTNNVLAAHTAWLQAESQKIDAQIDVKLTEINLKKALGTLGK